MHPRSSSSENLPSLSSSSQTLPHSESLQNLQSSRPLTVDNNHLNLPILPQDKTRMKSEHLRRTIVQEDMENIQERLNEMLIAVPSNDENSKPLLTEQKSTNEYFTPKISIEADDEEDDPLFESIESNTHPFFDVLTSTTYEKEVMKYLLNLEARFMTENDNLRSAKRLRQSSNSLKPFEGIPTPGCHSTVIITSKVRCKLIDWMISVHDYHRLNAAILCRTIHLIDRILLLNDQMTKLDLQLRAVNCFTIACKLESRRVPDAASLISLFDSRYHLNQAHLNHGEKHLLTQLDFELEYPLAIHFLCYYLRFLPFHFVIYSLSKYLVECALCDEQLAERTPGSLLASAALYLALKLTKQLEQKHIVRRFFKHQPYRQEELEKCTEKMMKLMQNISKSLYHTNVREKYKRSEFDRVAMYQFTNELVIPLS